MRLGLRSWPTYAIALVFACVAVMVAQPGCIFAVTQTSLGQGQGSVKGTLNAPDCWSGPFDLQPDFFAGVPYRDSLDIRIQNGSDFETFSDGLSILVDNVHAIRPDTGPGALGQPLKVSLPPGVVPPGVPITANPNPASVHVALYLGRSCHTQNVALYAMDQVTLNGSGTCDAVDGGTIQLPCGAGAVDASVPEAAVSEGGLASDASTSDAAPASPSAGGIGQSTITFTHLFDNNPDETDAAQRLTEATFQVYLADPRDLCPGGLGPPPPCRGMLTGSFKFYFQRGRPAQPFP